MRTGLLKISADALIERVITLPTGDNEYVLLDKGEYPRLVTTGATALNNLVVKPSSQLTPALHLPVPPARTHTRTDSTGSLSSSSSTEQQRTHQSENPKSTDSTSQLNHLGQPAPPRTPNLTNNHEKREPAEDDVSAPNSLKQSMSQHANLTAEDRDYTNSLNGSINVDDELAPPTQANDSEDIQEEYSPPDTPPKPVEPPARRANPPPPEPSIPEPTKKLPSDYFAKIDLGPVLLLQSFGGGKRLSNMRSFRHSSLGLLGVAGGGKKSGLTMLLNDKSGCDNPFSSDFSFFNGKTESDAITLKIYFPFADNPEVPLSLSIKRDARVEDVIGFALYEYVNVGVEPRLPVEVCDVVCWNMRIVEDDGAVDEDFPALERTRKIEKFSFDQFAVCEATPEQIKLNETTRKPPQHLQPPIPIPSQLPKQPTPTTITTPKKPEQQPQQDTPSTVTTYLLRVHLYSTLEVKQTTTLQLPSNMLLSEVFDVLCKKKKYDPKDYVLKMADTKTDVPLDKSLEQLKIAEFCVLKRDRGGAGDIFLRPPDESIQSTELPRFISTDEYTSMYKQYSVVYKHFMGRHERLLTIDGDYIHLVLSASKKILDISGKTVSYHINQVLSCKQAKKQSLQFKLVVRKDGSGEGNRSHDLEAISQQEAVEICTRISFMIQLSKK